MKKNIAAVLLFSLMAIHSSLQAQSTTDASILTTAEQMPEYPGGTDSLMRTIMGGVVYPKLCADSNIQGKVYLRFVVNEDGSVSNIEAIKSPHKLLSEAAIASMGKVQKFRPAKQGGKTVKVWYSLPVSFKIKTQPAVTPSSENFVNARNDSATFKFVEVMPEFPGGENALIKFLSANIHYPQFEYRNEIQGKVIVKFVVTEDGSIQDITTAQPLSPGLDEEAIRVVSMSPKWTPGLEKGKPVKVQYMLPVVFKITNSDRAPLLPKNIYDFMAGGRDEMDRFFSRNIVYPATAVSSKTEAKMHVICSLGTDLKLHPVSIKNNDSLFGPEAVRVINALPPLDNEVKNYSSLLTQTYDIWVPFKLNNQQYFSGNNDFWESKKLVETGTDFFKEGLFSKALEYFNSAIK